MARRIIAGSQFQDLRVTDFNGIDEYAYVDDPSFKTDTQGALLFRYRPTTLLSGTGLKTVISYGVRDAVNNSAFFINQRHVGSSGIPIEYRNAPIPDVACRATHDGVTNGFTARHIFSAADWASWVVQSNGSAWQHAINGIILPGDSWLGTNTGDWLADVSGTAHRLVIGSLFRNNLALNYSDHRHNEILYVDRPLTAGEISEWHNGGAVSNAHRLSFRSNIVSWWRMGESRDNNTTIFDEIGPNHLTLVNMSSANYLGA